MDPPLLVEPFDHYGGVNVGEGALEFLCRFVITPVVPGVLKTVTEGAREGQG